MATGALVGVDQYLSTSYDPDCDSVDGVIEERNFGEFDHAGLQAAVPLRAGNPCITVPLDELFEA